MGGAAPDRRAADPHSCLGIDSGRGGGMLFASLGQNAGWPWWIYHTLPATVTIALPPFAFRFVAAERWQHWPLASLVSPTIHVVFSLLLGWKDCTPFIPVPSIREILG